MELKGRIISRGIAEGEALVTNQPISFYGGVDPDKGIICLLYTSPSPRD